MIYAEQFTEGAWHPVTFADRPDLDDRNRLKRADGTGARVRAVQVVKREHEGMTLAALYDIYGPYGRYKGE